ncbi:MAG: hypothetical protein IKU45_00130 [Clostridia bacterium]|nr:hypothetical protein [Clostridia bacterium]
MKKIYTVLALVLALMIALCMSASAVGENITVVSNVSPFVYQNNVKNFLQAFNETNGGWDVSDSAKATENVTLSETISTFPYEPLTGNGSLIYRNKAATSGKANRITKKYSSPLDLSGYSGIIIATNCNEVQNSSYKIEVELKSGKRTFSADGVLVPCAWNCVFVDISEFAYRKSIDTFSISVTYENGEEGVCDFEFYIDSIALSFDGNEANGFLYSAQNYFLDDGTSAFGQDGFVVEASDVTGLTSSGFVYNDMADANCLMVDFSYDGICMGVSLRVFYSDGQYADISAIVEENRGKYLAYIPIEQKDISEIKLGFDVTGGQKLQIYFIEPYSSFVGESSSDTCAINYNTGEIIIRGGNVSQYSQKEIHLFVNDLCDRVTNESLKNQHSIAKGVAGSSDYIFRIKYSDLADQRAYLFKKFTVAVKLEDGYEIIGGSKCITNPESFTDSDGSEGQKGSGKGLYGQSIEFMQEMGVSDTAIWVDLGKFFTLGEGGEFSSGGDVLRYDLDYMNELDSQIQNFKEKNIRVTLVAVLTRGQDEELNKILVHPDAEKNAKYCAFNTTTQQGIGYLRAFAEYVGENYCKKGFVSGICVGDGVAYARENYNMGEKTLEYFTREYGNALRIVYNAVKSYSNDAEVYTYIDDNWDCHLPFDLYIRYDNRAFIASLGRYLSSQGDIFWSLSQNPYPQDKVNYYSYRDSSLSVSPETDKVSFRNIGVLDTYLSSSFLKYNNSTRRYVIIEKSIFTDEDELMLTADYVYNCYKALNSNAFSYITDRKSNYNNAMKYIDTNLSLTVSAFASDVLGVATWENVVEGFSEEKIIKREINSVNTLPTVPKYKGSMVIVDFSSDEHGFSRYGFSERLNSGMSLLEKDGLLSVSLGEIIQGQKRGIVKTFDSPLDLSKTPIHHFDVNVASLPEGVASSEITVVLVSGEKTFEVVGVAKGAEWTGIYCDVSAFTELDEVEEIKILFSAGEVNFDGPQALISSIEALSAEYDSEQLVEMFYPTASETERFREIRKYAVPILIIMSTVCLAVFIIRRFARR